jgi:hypothetical protein
MYIYIYIRIKYCNYLYVTSYKNIHSDKHKKCTFTSKFLNYKIYNFCGGFIINIVQIFFIILNC